MRVLVADDDPVTLHMVTYRLTQLGYEVIGCADGPQALAALESNDPPRLAIVDWMMPEPDGLALCRYIRTRSAGPYIYTILLTGKDEKQDRLIGLQAGADDYLTKPFDLQELEARVRIGQRIVDLENKLVAAHEALKKQAMQDPLTGALNHGAILDILFRELARAQREHHPLSIILADLDEFKRINDVYGHLVGDHVLVEATRRFQHNLRPYDAVGRYGGEEFLIVLPASDPPTAMGQAERIRLALSQHPFLVGGTELTVTVSQGVSTWMEPQDPDLVGLINAADNALYLAKNSGRNRVEYLAYDAKARPSISISLPTPSFYDP
ncbi:MAG: diguanylate cyclase [Nitrospirae bacterium]|nr:MAG: diguanylate cyclase [Nitrospirota bacterium]